MIILVFLPIFSWSSFSSETFVSQNPRPKSAIQSNSHSFSYSSYTHTNTYIYTSQKSESDVEIFFFSMSSFIPVDKGFLSTFIPEVSPNPTFSPHQNLIITYITYGSADTYSNHSSEWISIKGVSNVACVIVGFFCLLGVIIYFTQDEGANDAEDKNEMQMQLNEPLDSQLSGEPPLQI